MRMFIFLLHLSFIYNLYADVSKCESTNEEVSTTYSSAPCDPGIKYCIKATCPGTTGAIRGCDGDHFQPFCSSTGCHDVNNAITQGYGCTGAASICCCDTDNCNDDSDSNSPGSTPSGGTPDVSKCENTKQEISTTYSSAPCDPGIKYCVSATCPGKTGAIRGCDGDHFQSFCSSTGCYSLNNSITQGYGCTGAANICCCDTDNCNGDSGSNSSGVSFRFYLGTISVLMLILFTILSSF